MSAKRFTPGGGAGKSFKLVWNSTPCWALVSCAKVANSGPPGPEAPVVVVDGNDVMNEMEQEDSDTAKDEKRGRKKKGSGVSKKVTQLHSNCKECSLHMVQSKTKSQMSNKQHQQTQLLSSVSRLLTGSQEPRFDNIRQGRTRNVATQHLFGVIPTHATIGGTATHQNNLGLSFFDFNRHDEGDDDDELQ